MRWPLARPVSPPRSIVALEDLGIAPGDGAIEVTGATGGVGSTAVNILGAKGFEVIASSGKPEAAAYLKSLGASEVIDRAEFSAEGKPLQPMVYAGAVDCVGGPRWPTCWPGSATEVRWRVRA